MLVQTIKGLIARESLEVKDSVEEHDNARVVATEWFLSGEMVRRDVHVSILRGHSLAGEQAAVG